MTSNLNGSAGSRELPPNAIAVVGLAGRFPGADTATAFWRNLRADEEAIVTLSEDDLLAAGVSEKSLANHSYIRRGSLLDGVDEFDAEFFGFTPQAARMMDPQHRLFLQSAWHALEDAGYDPQQIEGSVGVFGTSSASGYLLHNLMSHIDPNQIIGEGATFEMINLSLQNDKDHLATRAAHQFNLRGPALSVQTACSSSLVAVHLACQSILNGECEMALAGGSSIRVPHRVGYWHEPGSMVSATGHCRPFDVRADGTIFGSGVGVVVLKALQDALDDGDRIHAVIRGSAINNDGSTKMNYAAPNAAGQAEVIAEAHAIADVDAATIGFVETHGTGTPLGDPIEIEGLRQAFELSEQPRSGPCVLGSVKSNIGHLEVASGIVSLIKTILCLENRGIPGTLHYTSPNPELHLDRGPFEIHGQYRSWESDGPRRAGVSSFGVGGTNVHVVLEEAPTALPVQGSGDVPVGPQVLLLSARSAEALTQARSDLAAELRASDEINMADVAHTLAGRRTEKVRLAAVVHDRRHGADVLAAEENDNVFVDESAAPVPGSSEEIVFLFPGQGAQHVGMARGLYDAEAVFADHFDRSASAFSEELDVDLRSEIFEGSARDLERTDRAQAALFTVEYALAKLIESYGIRPTALAGHSIGEYAAAAVAGVFDLPTAVKAVSMRARLMHAAPRGVMVAVPVSAQDITGYLSADVDLAAVNDPGSSVVAGSEEAIAAFQERLAQEGIVARRVRTSHAFHSRLMDGVVPEFTGYLSRLTLGSPQLPLLSNITGTWMSTGEATNPATWARQIRATVRFSDELGVLLEEPGRVFVEVGPGGTLTGSATRHPKWSPGHRAVRLMRHQAQNRSDHDTFLLALGQLSCGGVQVDWSQRSAGRAARRITLPGYSFARQSHWLDHNRAQRWVEGAGSAAVDSPSGSPAAGDGKTPMETTLQRIWSQCLGVSSVGRTANFFDLGGDSLIAISVAMTATREGLDLTPQDLYENPTVAALARELIARYAAGGLARQAPGEVQHPPIPPNVEHFLERGLADAHRWRIPLILRLRRDIAAEDIATVLTAVTNHHDALRMKLTPREGIWEQQIAEKQESTELPTASLPDGVDPDGPQAREAVLAILDEHVGAYDLTGPLLSAVLVDGASGGPRYLALSLHGVVGDGESRDILLTDLFTAFGQLLAGEPVVLQPVSTSWREWSQRCAALATHPAVVESRDFWLTTARKGNLRVAAGEVPDPPSVADLGRLSSTLTAAETTELDDARRRLRVGLEELLLTALSRAVATVVGDGTVLVDLAGNGRSVLKPDLDPRRTVGLFTTLYPMALDCAPDVDGGVRHLLEGVRDAMKEIPHYGIGYGLLRYLYAPAARQLGATPPADIFVVNAGTIPDLPAEAADGAPVQFDSDTALSVREAIPGLGHAIELRVYRSAGTLHLDWWYDGRRIAPSVAESLAEGFSANLMTITREAIVEDEMDSVGDELVLVDLSSADVD